jgi:hypothetical protein
MLKDFLRVSGARTATLAATLAVFGLSTAASAATFNFEAIADGATFTATSGGGTVSKTGAEGNWNLADGISGFGPIVGAGEGIVDGGITVWAKGLNSDASKTADAFFDAGRAGLGVCSSRSCKTGVRGAIASDDNLNTSIESLVLSFSETVKITSLKIRNAGHGLANGSFVVNGNAYSLSNGLLDANGLAALAASGSYTLNYLENGPELYVAAVTVAAVPIPAAGILLATAIAGGAAAGRRRKARG